MKGLKIDARSAAAGGAAGLVVGLCAGYFAQRHTFQARFDREVLALKEHYGQRIDVLELMARGLPDLDAPAAGDEDLREAAVGSDSPEPPAESEFGAGGVEISPEEIDAAILQAAEERLRQSRSIDTSKPYQISEEEFVEGKEGHQSLTITYYAGDKVLTDDKAQPIPDILRTVGMLSREMFGTETVRYVRNEKLEIDFEIVLSNGSYVDEVLHYGRPGRGEDAAERPATDD